MLHTGQGRWLDPLAALQPCGALPAKMPRAPHPVCVCTAGHHMHLIFHTCGLTADPSRVPQVTRTRVLTCSLQAHHIHLITFPLTAACRPQTTWVKSSKELGVALLDLLSWSRAAAVKGRLTRVLPGVLHTRVLSCTLLPSQFPRDQAGSDLFEGMA